MTTHTTTLPAATAGAAARTAVEITRLGSAGLSASYYAMLGLAVPPVVCSGVSIPAAAIALGGLAASLDYVKGAMLSIGLGGRGWGGWRRTCALALGLVLFVASSIAIDGVLMKLRSMVSAGPADVISKHDDTSNDLKAAKDKLLTLADVPTTLQVQEQMKAARVSKAAFNATKQCNDFTGWLADYKKACKPILELRVTMAQAIDKADLEDRRDVLQAKLDALGPKPASADPQATAIASVSGLPETFVLLLLVGILGAAIELVSCFGRFAIERPVAKAATQKAETPATGPEQLRQPIDAATVADWHPGKPWAGPLAQPTATETAQSSFPVGTQRKPGNRGNGGSVVRLQPKAPRNPGNGGGTAATRPSSRQEFEQDVVTRLALGQHIDRYDDLADQHGVHKGTVSKWLGSMRERGLVPEGERVGRCKMIAPASAKATAE